MGGQVTSRRVVVVGAHPDDPETCAGGLAARAVDAGHDVIFVYLTDGQIGVAGVGPSEAAGIRREEARTACRIIGANPVFLGQADGGTIVSTDTHDLMRRTLVDLRPDVVVTHWPIDTHRDHRACSSLVLDAWVSLGEPFALYYMEAMSGYQTRNFIPTIHVPIDDVVERKHEACFAHASQLITAFSYDEQLGHGKMERARGAECDSRSAEAYVRQDGTRGTDLAELVDARVAI